MCVLNVNVGTHERNREYMHKYTPLHCYIFRLASVCLYLRCERRLDPCQSMKCQTSKGVHTKVVLHVVCSVYMVADRRPLRAVVAPVAGGFRGEK